MNLNDIDKRSASRIAASLTALIALVVVIWYVSSQQTTTPAKPAAPTAKATPHSAPTPAQTLHQAALFADSVGIDTTRFTTTTTDSDAAIRAKLTRLLLLIRYGEKPARIAFNGLKPAIDSAWAAQTDNGFTNVMQADATPVIAYQQLIGHYNRLRQRNTGADSLRQLRQTMNYHRYMNRFAGDTIALVNIPAAELTVFDRNRKRLLSMAVIVGSPDRKTPCMTTSVQQVVTYPYWNVPESISLDEMLPRMQRDPTYIYNQDLHILDQEGHEIDPEEIDWDGLSTNNFPYRIRQGTGDDNALGLVKFVLNNPLAIYLHDTNQRGLFKISDYRWRSHGCIRVKKPIELANLVLQREALPADFLTNFSADQRPKPMRVPKPFPVFIAYNTADVDSTGQLRFYRDVYGFDKKAEPAM